MARSWGKCFTTTESRPNTSSCRKYRGQSESTHMGKVIQIKQWFISSQTTSIIFKLCFTTILQTEHVSFLPLLPRKAKTLEFSSWKLKLVLCALWKQRNREAERPLNSEGRVGDLACWLQRLLVILDWVLIFKFLILFPGIAKKSPGETHALWNFHTCSICWHQPVLSLILRI